MDTACGEQGQQVQLHWVNHLSQLLTDLLLIDDAPYI
jgi:hypothetical protein